MFIYAVLLAFFVNILVPMPLTQAQPASEGGEFYLPRPGTMVDLSPAFEPPVLVGVKFHRENAFQFDFILDTGDRSAFTQEQIKQEGQKLISYFLASLATPEEQIWVNLSPYEKQRIVPSIFGQTQMGQTLLGQDYLLKQIMATALYPEKALGRQFWRQVYAQTLARFGTTDVAVSTFNKVWIVPDKAVVYENPSMNAVFVVESSLKVMLDKDYLAANKHKAQEQYGLNTLTSDGSKEVNSLSSAIIKKIVIPALEKEVNEGRNFAPLRQVYQSMILAKWYKENLRQNVIAQAYVNRNKTLGIQGRDKNLTQKIYLQYLRAYRKGVYNYIKEEVDPATQTAIPRKYFSGGMEMGKNLKLSYMDPGNPGSRAMMSNFAKRIAKQAGIFMIISGLGVLTSIASPASAKNVLVTDLTKLNPSAATTGIQRQETTVTSASWFQQMKEQIKGWEGFRKYFYHDTHVPSVELVGFGTSKIWEEFIPAEVLFGLRPITRTEAEKLMTDVLLANYRIISNFIGGRLEFNSLPVNAKAFLLKVAYQGNALLLRKFSALIKAGDYSGALVLLGQSNLSNHGNRTRDLVHDLLTLMEKTRAAGPGHTEIVSNNDHAMSSPGGIDLEKISLARRAGSGEVATAFSDPVHLQLLKNASGLMPVIYEIKAVTLSSMDIFLGLNKDSPAGSLPVNS